MSQGQGSARRAASGAARGRGRRQRRGRWLLEPLERRSLLTIYSPTGVTLSPSPVEGTAFAGAVVGTFASSDPLSGLSAIINWGPAATPTASIGTINLIGSVLVPGVGAVPQYSVTGGTTYARESGGASLPIAVVVGDAADSTNGLIFSSTTVADAPLTATGGLTSATVIEGSNVDYSGAIAPMTFTDGNPNSTPADFRATIDWGDGTPATTGIITKSGATYRVGAAHTYTRPTASPLSLVVTVTDGGGQTATHTTALSVNEAALGTPTGFAVDAAAGQMLSNVTLGTFLSGNPFAYAGDFNARIDWGDGVTNDQGTVTLVGGSGLSSRFAVSGSHTYTDPSGSPYPVTVTVTKRFGSTTTIHTTATVAQAPLAVSVPSFNAVAATPTPAQVVATFFDPSGAYILAGYSAVVNWGDGTSNDIDSGVAIDPVEGQPGSFRVTAPAHTYAAPGLYPITVSVEGSDSTSGSGNGSALVAAASLVAAGSPAGPIDGAVEGRPIPASTQLATFTSGDPGATAAGFTAVVDWGDGTPTTLGTITQPGGAGTPFLVSGGHTYAEEDPAGYTVTVSITDAYHDTVVATTPVTSVADAPLTTGTPLPVQAIEHQRLVSVPVATFVDTNPSATAGDFAATIRWGDGTVADANAQVILVGGDASGAIFAVYGSHTYDAAGPFTIGVDVADVGGQSLSIAPLTPNATVASSTLLISALPQTADANRTIPAGTYLGTFTVLPGAGPVGSYAFAVNWGDGTGNDTGIDITPVGGSTFRLSTQGGHTYASPGTYALRLSVSAPASWNVGGSLVVVPAAAATLPVLTPGGPISAVEGAPLSGAVVATFNDSSPGVTTSSFGVTIDWGDGSPASAGVVVNGGGAGGFVVLGNHTYAEEGGPFVVSVSLTNTAGNRVSTSTTAVVADAPLSGASGLAVAAGAGVPLAGVPLGTFVDGNRGASAADFAATIDWGDGTAASPGFVTLVGGSASGALFSVAGGHVYAAPGTFNVTVAIRDVGGSTATINTQATVAASQAAQLAAGPGIPVAATEGIATAAGQVIATFTDGANLAPAGDFAAAIDWGDGTPAVPGAIAANGVGYSVTAPSHTYAEQGTYVIRVTIRVVSNPTVSVLAASFAAVADAPLSPVATPLVLATEGVPLANVAVGSFNDTNPGGTTGGFLATISWGDGTTGFGSISQPGGAGTPFVVLGSHTYGGASANGTGQFPIDVVVRDDGGQRLLLANTAIVADVPINVSAILDPRDDRGASDSDGITNDNTPSFLGSSAPGSTIRLYVTSASGTMLAGQAVAGADGRFTVPVNVPLADGSYTVSVDATGASGRTTASSTLSQPLVIDTVGPKVTGLRFDRVKGQVIATLVDDRSGLDPAALVDGTNYQFGTYVPAHPTRRSPYFVTSLSATAAARPTDPQSLTISIKRGRYLSGGRYLLTIDSAGGAGTLARDGLCDVAGNALDGEFYGRFASGNHRPGGDFVAGLNAIQRTVFPPSPTRDGYATPLNPPGTPATRATNPVVIPPELPNRPGRTHPTRAFARFARHHAVHAHASAAPTRGRTDTHL